MTSTKKKSSMSPEHYNSGLINPAGDGTRNTGFDELSITHPYSNGSIGGAAN
jgi:hypothetical protein